MGNSFARYLLRTVLSAAVGSAPIAWGLVWINGYEESQVLFTILFVVVMAMLLGGVIGLANYRRFVAPMAVFVEHISEVSQGNLSVRVDESRVGELKPIARSLNAMSENWEQLIADVGKMAVEVAALSQQLSASAHETTHATTQITMLIQEVAEGAETQASGTASSAERIGEVAAGIRDIAARSAQVTDASRQMAEDAEEGNRSIEAVVAQMALIGGSVDRLSGVISHLESRSEEIGQILEVITGIAGQTNLLALNANIEAARAGEHGKGFAVVADEVRKLADQSRESAGRIEGLILEIRRDTSQAVTVMGSGVAEVRTGTELAQRAGEAFRQIVGTAARIAEQNREVSAVTRDIAAGSQQATATVSDMTGIAERSASHSQSVAAASEEQLASMEQINQTSLALSDMAQQLHQIVDRIQVEKKKGTRS